VLTNEDVLKESVLLSVSHQTSNSNIEAFLKRQREQIRVYTTAVNPNWA